MGTRDDLLADLRREGRRMGSSSTLHNQACAEVVGLQPSDWACLDVLDWTGPVTAGHLAEQAGLTSGAITGVVDRLERVGFVRRAPDPADRRKVMVVPVRPRDRELGAAFALLADEVDALAGRYDDAELAVIVDFLRGANAALAESTERMRAAARARKRANGGAATTEAPAATESPAAG